MALRTFSLNPALGGFGNESTNACVVDLNQELKKDLGLDESTSSSSSSSGDAWAQIIKELVDNAVDACRHYESSSSNDSDKKRVRVMIDAYDHSLHGVIPLASKDGRNTKAIEENSLQQQEHNDNDDNSDDRKIFRVTVVDNGCGMKSVQKAVEPFHTSKSKTSKDNLDIGRAQQKKCDHKEGKDKNGKGSQTTGRYGVGLTLSILHAQRLVPDSCACIQTATSTQPDWTSVICIADTDNDLIRCFDQPSKPKSFSLESGTAVSVLVPGGSMARISWPRLAEYFARFHLCSNLSCSIEVSTSVISQDPLIVQEANLTNSHLKHRMKAVRSNILIENWKEGFDDTAFFLNEVKENGKGDVDESKRMQIQDAVARYLEQNVPIECVAHSTVTVKNNLEQKHAASRVEVDVVVVNDQDFNSDFCKRNSTEENSAKLSIIRFINDTPMLDSIEASTCGIVKHLMDKKRVWNDYGLELAKDVQLDAITSTPTMKVADSSHVSAFFDYGTHRIFRSKADHLWLDDHQNKAESQSYDNSKRRKQQRESHPFLPAKLRLGNILVILKIFTDISFFGLPSLAKDRISTDDKTVLKSLELGLSRCLKQLQKLNPTKLLTPKEMRQMEWDKCFLPAMARSLMSISQRSQHLQNLVLPLVEDRCFQGQYNTNKTDNGGDAFDENISTNVVIFEKKLRHILAPSTNIVTCKSKKQRVVSKNERKKEDVYAEIDAEIFSDAERMCTETFLTPSVRVESPNGVISTLYSSDKSMFYDDML